MSSSLSFESPSLAALADLAPVSLTDFVIHQRLQEGSGFQAFKIQVNRPQDRDTNQYFSLKCPRNKSKSREVMEQEALNLKKEAKMMQKFKHPNIVNAVGISAHSPLSYFLAYDLIEETLADRIQSWKTGTPIKTAAARRKLEKTQSPNKKGKFGAPPLDERLFQCILGTARAMMYLHARHIVNPLRPDCIGFDRNGTVKIFDFSVYSDDPTTNHLRYMSPEYIVSNEASFASDVYSLGTIIWQVATLKEPFSFVLKMKSKPKSNTKERNKVIANKIARKRPETRSVHDKGLRDLVKDCWDSNPDARPSATRMLFRLAECLPKQESNEQRMDRIEGILRSHQAKMTGGGGGGGGGESVDLSKLYNSRITR